MDLRAYEQHKFAVAEILRSASTVAPREMREWHDQAQELFARLAEDRFNLVVVGRFNRGKTSLMNAIMGTDRLPTGIVSLTSVVTTVAYGSREQVVLHYQDRILTSEIAIDDLPQYVTQEGNPGNVRGINNAEVQLPAEILRRGFHFVDTPGLGSAITENTQTTEAYLPEADAFLLVTSYESPLSDDEMRFLHAVSSTRRIFVVLNKHDTVTSDERHAVRAYVKHQLSSLFGGRTPRIFSVSARDGLRAKRSQDTALLKESGLPVLEGQLVEFLLNEKSTEFLLAICDRVVGLLQRSPISANAPDLVEKVNTLIRQIAQDDPDTRRGSVGFGISPTGRENVQQLRPCEICAHVNQALWDFLSRFQYDLSISNDEQRRFAEARGLCSFHTWQYECIASPQGTCTSYPPLLDSLAKRLRNAGSTQSRDAPLLTDIEERALGRNDCIMCAVQSQAEMEAITKAARQVSEDGSRVELVVSHLPASPRSVARRNPGLRTSSASCLIVKRQLSNDFLRT